MPSLLKVFSGWLCDRLGDRKGLTVPGYSPSTAAKPLLYFANTWGGVLGVRFADRVGRACDGARRRPGGRQHRREALWLAFGLTAPGIPPSHDRHRHLPGRALSCRAAISNVGHVSAHVLISFVPALVAVLVLAFGAEILPGDNPREAPRLPLAGFDHPLKLFLPVIILFTLGNSWDASWCCGPRMWG